MPQASKRLSGQAAHRRVECIGAHGEILAQNDSHAAAAGGNMSAAKPGICRRATRNGRHFSKVVRSLPVRGEPRLPRQCLPSGEAALFLQLYKIPLEI